MRRPLSPAAEAAWEAPLSPEEFHRRLAIALADREQIQENAGLCAWFCRRYPTAGERLAYVRRKYAEWTRPSERVAPEASEPEAGEPDAGELEAGEDAARDHGRAPRDEAVVSDGGGAGSGAEAPAGAPPRASGEPL